MATVSDYLTQLQTDKQTLVDNLVAKGVEATSDETFTTLAPKVADIQSGGSNVLIEDATYLFRYNARLDQIEELCAIISPECTNFTCMFERANNLKIAPMLNTSNGIEFTSMFSNCTNLTEIPELDTSKATIIAGMFYGCSELTSIPMLNTSNVTDFYTTFSYCYALTTIPELDTSKATKFYETFGYCSALTTIPELDTSNVTTFSNFIAKCTALTTLGGFKNAGKGYTRTTTNYSPYTLDLSYATLLTHESLMNVINKLYDLNLTFDVANGGTLYTQSLVIATECQELLTEEEIVIATNKGWNVSFA